MGKFCLTAVLCNDHSIVPQVGSLLRRIVRKIRIFADNVGRVSGINHCQSLVSGNHIVDYVVSCINRLHAVSLMDQPLVRFLDFLLAGSIHGITQSLQGNHKGIPLGIVHIKISLIFRICQKIPAIL